MPGRTGAAAAPGPRPEIHFIPASAGTDMSAPASGPDSPAPRTAAAAAPGATSSPDDAPTDASAAGTGGAEAVPAGPLPARHPHLWFVGVTLVMLLADLGSKELIFRGLGWPSERMNPRPVPACTDDVAPSGPHCDLIPCVFRLHTSLNSGGIWGNFDGSGTYLALFSVLAAGVVFYMHRVTPASQWIRRGALGLLLAGAAGNFYDRVFIRPDFVEFRHGGRESGRLADVDIAVLRGAEVLRVPMAEVRTLVADELGGIHLAKVDGTTVEGRLAEAPVFTLHPNWQSPDAAPPLRFALYSGGGPAYDVVRIRRGLGAVRDFLHVHWKAEWNYPIFNLADSWLCVGVAILLLAGLKEWWDEVVAARAGSKDPGAGESSSGEGESRSAQQPTRKRPVKSREQAESEAETRSAHQPTRKR